MAQRFLINPKRRKAARKGSGTRRRRTAAQRAATARMLAANVARRRTSKGGKMATKRKRKAAAPRKRRRKVTRRNPGMLANPRRRRRATARKVTRRRRSVRRNPSIGGALSLVTRGVKDAAYMVGGEMASNIVAGYIPALLKGADGVETQTGAQLRKVISAVVVGFGAQQLFKGRGDAARFMVAGALAAPIKQVIRPLLPTTGVLSGALASYPRLAAYPTPVPVLTAGRGALTGYARRGVGVGCSPDDASNGNGAAFGFGG
jgi:hypothetical protein